MGKTRTKIGQEQERRSPTAKQAARRPLRSDDDLRQMLCGGDRRSLAQSAAVRKLVESEPSRIAALARLTQDGDWLVVLRALDLLEKFALSHPDRIAPYKKLFTGALADSEKWELRLQVVRALPAFRWNARELPRVERILLENTAHPQLFVRAWALDSLATLSLDHSRLAPTVARTLAEFERSGRKALESRARAIRARLAAHARSS